MQKYISITPEMINLSNEQPNQTSPKPVIPPKPIQDPKHEDPIKDPKPDSPIYDPKPEIPIRDPKPDDPLKDPNDPKVGNPYRI